MFRGLAATLSCGNFSAGVGKRPRSPGGGSGTRFREFQFGGAPSVSRARNLAQEVLHLRGYVSGMPRTRIGKGVGSDRGCSESLELLRTCLLRGTSVNKNIRKKSEQLC